MRRDHFNVYAYEAFIPLVLENENCCNWNWHGQWCPDGVSDISEHVATKLISIGEVRRDVYQLFIVA